MGLCRLEMVATVIRKIKKNGCIFEDRGKAIRYIYISDNGLHETIQEFYCDML